MALIGGLSVLSLILKFYAKRLGVAPLVGFLLLGLGLNTLFGDWLTKVGETSQVLEFVSSLGLACLLFRVGLESDFGGLIRQLSSAWYVWLLDVSVSGGLAFLCSYYIFSLPFVTSLFLASALSATSVGVSVAIWQEKELLKTDSGELLIDIAEMDDISAIFLLALLIGISPHLINESDNALVSALLSTFGFLFLKLLLFWGACYVFASFIRKPLVKGIQRIGTPMDAMVIILGFGFVIAGLAGILGLSIAVGAFLAGILFSGETDVLQEEQYFLPVYELFVPFFFIHVGLQTNPAAAVSGAALGSGLFIAAVLGKLLGAGCGSIKAVGSSVALLIAISMIPRAEIAMIIVDREENWAAGLSRRKSMAPWCLFLQQHAFLYRSF